MNKMVTNPSTKSLSSVCISSVILIRTKARDWMWYHFKCVEHDTTVRQRVTRFCYNDRHLGFKGLSLYKLHPESRYNSLYKKYIKILVRIMAS